MLGSCRYKEFNSSCGASLKISYKMLTYFLENKDKRQKSKETTGRPSMILLYPKKYCSAKSLRYTKNGIIGLYEYNTMNLSLCSAPNCVSLSQPQFTWALCWSRTTHSSSYATFVTSCFAVCVSVRMCVFWWVTMLLGEVDSVIMAVRMNRFIRCFRLSLTSLVRVLLCLVSLAHELCFCFEFVHERTWMQDSFLSHHEKVWSSIKRFSH